MPFDDDYKPLLRPLLFTLIYLGLRPRIALERFESGESRITKIIELIEDSKYAIHDLSRIKAKKKGEVFRLNMPFELGIDVGCKQFGRPPLNSKRLLILEAERYTYQAAISDLSGSDIGVHKNQAEEMVVTIRNWIANQHDSRAVGKGVIWSAFNDCMAQSFNDLPARGFDRKEIENFPIPELMEYMVEWVGARLGRAVRNPRP